MSISDCKHSVLYERAVMPVTGIGTVKLGAVQDHEGIRQSDVSRWQSCELIYKPSH